MDDVLSWLPSWLNHQPEKSVFCPHDLRVIPPGFIILLFFEHVLLLKNNELIISDGKRHGLNHVKPPFLLAKSPNMSALLRGQLPFSSVSPAAEVQKVPFWSVGRPGFVGHISYFFIFFFEYCTICSKSVLDDWPIALRPGDFPAKVIPPAQNWEVNLTGPPSPGTEFGTCAAILSGCWMVVWL